MPRSARESWPLSRQVHSAPRVAEVRGAHTKGCTCRRPGVLGRWDAASRPGGGGYPGVQAGGGTAGRGAAAPLWLLPRAPVGSRGARQPGHGSSLVRLSFTEPRRAAAPPRPLASSNAHGQKAGWRVQPQRVWCAAECGRGRSRSGLTCAKEGAPALEPAQRARALGASGSGRGRQTEEKHWRQSWERGHGACPKGASACVNTTYNSARGPSRPGRGGPVMYKGGSAAGSGGRWKRRLAGPQWRREAWGCEGEYVLGCGHK
jgi:hypothetical protein